MASTSSDASERAAGASGSSDASVPAPLPSSVLAGVPGTLGGIARERAADYASVPVEASVGRGGAHESSRPGAGRPASGRFEDALSGPGLALIAEVKRGSPSQGSIADLDPVAAAQAYVRGGASALSVLTEPRHFGGRLDHLAAVAGGVDVPAMRKEFVVHPAQLREAADAGAAAALLIVAVLGDRLEDYLAYAHALGLDALVETHDEQEVEVALEAGARIVGVNNRDLATLDIDRATAPRLLRRAREAGFRGRLVAESGYERPEDLGEVADVADAVLVGTALARQDDLEAAVRRWSMHLGRSDA